MDEITAVRAFRAHVPERDDAARAVALTALEAALAGPSAPKLPPRWRSRRILALVLAAAGLVAVAAVSSAFGWPGRVLDVIAGEPAPPRVRDALALQNEGRERVLPIFRQHASMDLIVERTHGVVGIESSVGLVILWAAPTRGGGSCWIMEIERYPHPPDVSGCSSRSPRKAAVIQAGYGRVRLDEGILELVDGRVRNDVASVEVRYENGESDTVEVFEGFFLHEPRARPAMVVAHDANDAVLGRQRVRALELPIPPILTGPERELIRFTTSSGHTLSMTVAPGQNGQLCQSVYYRGTSSRVCGQDPRGRVAPEELSIRPGLQNEAQDGKPLVTLNGVVGTAIARLELELEDGTVVPVALAERFVLFEIPPEHHDGARFALVGRDEAGTVLARRIVK